MFCDEVLARLEVGLGDLDARSPMMNAMFLLSATDPKPCHAPVNVLSCMRCEN